MRAAATEAEATLWGIVRDRRLADFKFRRQVPMGRYIVDLYCPAARLIIELDGSQHAEGDYDTVRDAWLRAQGYRVLRLWNNDLTDNRDGVLTAIWHALQPPPHPPFGHPLPQGERDDVAPFGQRAAAGGRSAAEFRPSNPSPLEGEGGAPAPGEGKDSKGQHP
ncbi:endonuclease domain-containing protein [Devosia sp.]|uniref:endonuclease domain-containing protein n=1 Tax=Devosia sp. TaxID=1871048 RepID=UPI0035B0A113